MNFLVESADFWLFWRAVWISGNDWRGQKSWN